MGLVNLKILHFRNLLSSNLFPHPKGINFIYGGNGSGKTSLLESIYYLSMARSFRTLNNDRIITNGCEELSLFGQIELTSNLLFPVGLKRTQSGEITIRLNGKDISSIAELAKALPVQLIDSQTHNLLSGSPSLRRKYVDWGAFYLIPDFYRAWRDYTRALKQRNAALRARLSTKEIALWTQELVDNTEILNQFRQHYLNLLLPLLTRVVQTLLPHLTLHIKYSRGWKEEIDYTHVLADSLSRDIQLGFTQFGAHRAELKISINQLPAKDILSRGQQKLLVCAMIIAQGALLQTEGSQQPIYLVDDLPAELDDTSRARLIALLSQQNTQTFVTAVEPKGWKEFANYQPTKLFHVEHGKVTEISQQEIKHVEYEL